MARPNGLGIELQLHNLQHRIANETLSLEELREMTERYELMARHKEVHDRLEKLGVVRNAGFAPLAPIVGEPGCCHDALVSTCQPTLDPQTQENQTQKVSPQPNPWTGKTSLDLTDPPLRVSVRDCKKEMEEETNTQCDDEEGRAQEQDQNNDYEKEGAQNIAKKYFTDEESRHLWRFASIPPHSRDWHTFAEEAQAKPEIFHPEHATPARLRNRLYYMLRSPESIEMFSAKYGRIMPQGGKRKRQGKSLTVKSSLQKGKENTTVSMKSGYTSAELRRIWRFGYINGRCDWSNISKSAAGRTGAPDMKRFTPDRLRKKFAELAHPNHISDSCEKYGDSAGSSGKRLKAKGGDKEDENRAWKDSKTVTKGKEKVAFTDEECRVVWHFGYVEKRDDWKVLAEESKLHPEIFHPNHMNPFSLRSRFRYMMKYPSQVAKFKKMYGDEQRK